MPASTHAGGFDVQNVAAHWRPGQSGGDADLGDFFRAFGNKRCMAKICMQLLGINLDGCGCAVFRDDFARGFPHDGGNLALQLPHACLARVFANQQTQRGIRKLHVTFGEPVFLRLAG